MEKVLRGRTPSKTTPRNRSFLAISGRMKPRLPGFSASETTTSVPVDVVDLRGGVGLKISVQTGLDGSDRNGHFGFSTMNTPDLFAEQNGKKCAFSLLGLVGNVSLAALAVVEVGQCAEQLIGVYAEQGTVIAR